MGSTKGLKLATHPLLGVEVASETCFVEIEEIDIETETRKSREQDNDAAKELPQVQTKPDRLRMKRKRKTPVPLAPVPSILSAFGEIPACGPKPVPVAPNLPVHVVSDERARSNSPFFSPEVHEPPLDLNCDEDYLDGMLIASYRIIKEDEVSCRLMEGGMEGSDLAWRCADVQVSYDSSESSDGESVYPLGDSSNDAAPPRPWYTTLAAEVPVPSTGGVVAPKPLHVNVVASPTAPLSSATHEHIGFIRSVANRGGVSPRPDDEASSSEEEEEDEDDDDDIAAAPIQNVRSRQLRPAHEFRPDPFLEEEGAEEDILNLDDDPEYEPEEGGVFDEEGGDEEPYLHKQEPAGSSGGEEEEFLDPDTPQPRRKRARPSRAKRPAMPAPHFAQPATKPPPRAKRVHSREAVLSSPMVTGKRERRPNQLFAKDDTYVTPGAGKASSAAERPAKVYEDLPRLPLVPLSSFRQAAGGSVPSNPGQLMHPYFVDHTRGFHSNKAYAKYRSLHHPGMPDMPSMETEAPERRTQIWNGAEKRKVTGNAAPLERNLEKYLLLHPDCEVYVHQDRSLLDMAQDDEGGGFPGSSDQDEEEEPMGRGLGGARRVGRKNDGQKSTQRSAGVYGGGGHRRSRSTTKGDPLRWVDQA